MTLRTVLLGACSAMAMFGFANAETTLTIATVNNGDMIRMQKLTDDFTSKNPDIKLEWVTLEENVLRERVTTDIATKGGQYDVMTIGTRYFTQTARSCSSRAFDLCTIWLTANGAAGRCGLAAS